MQNLIKFDNCQFLLGYQLVMKRVNKISQQYKTITIFIGCYRVLKIAISTGNIKTVIY